MKELNNKRRDEDAMAFDHVADKLSPEALGAVVAFLFAILRLLGEKHDDKMSWRRMYRVLIEGLTCAAIALVASPGIEMFDLDPKMNMVLGAFIGFVGSQVIRIAAVSLLNKKVK